MASNEQSLAVAPDSTGKKIRNLEITTFIAGVPTSVEMQVVSLSDAQGNTINGEDFAEAARWQNHLNYLQRICGALEEIAGGIFYAEPDDIEDPT